MHQSFVIIRDSKFKRVEVIYEPEMRCNSFEENGKRKTTGERKGKDKGERDEFIWENYVSRGIPSAPHFYLTFFHKRQMGKMGKIIDLAW